MKDVQARVDHRGIALHQVGVSGLNYPVELRSKDGGRQHTVASFAMSVSLPHNVKGTHMSRFIEVLNLHHDNISMESFPFFLKAMKTRLQAETSRVEMGFHYFLKREAPVSGAVAQMGFHCRIVGEMKGDACDLQLEVKVPVTSLCPCSKEISDFGAHNQRGTISLAVCPMVKDGIPVPIWIEDLVAIAETSGSSPVYPLLKRADERHVTMQAYENPAFVEDIVRNVVLGLRRDPRIAWGRVHVENFESIHDHSAFAMTEWGKEDPLSFALVS